MNKNLKIETSEEIEEKIETTTKEEITKNKKKTLKSKIREKVKHRWLYRKVYLSIRKIHKVVNSPSFFPEYERKSKLLRYYENYKWLFRFNRYNPSYNLFGLDVKNFRNFDDYVDIKYIKKDRLKNHHQNDPLATHRKENITIRYSLLADNKHLFYSYISSMNDKLVPKTHMVFQGEKLISPFDENHKIKSTDYLKTLPEGKYICKATIGAFGDNIYVIEKKKTKFVINKGEKTLEEFLEETSHEPYLIQEFIKQHKTINKINPDTVNTIRIISTRWNEDTNILAAMMRLGTKGNIVDNASNGGTFVGVDIEKGTLMEYGYYYDKPREKCHPDTKTVYKDYKIPYWEETIKIIKELHPIIFGLSTIGWDIAITENGPVIVEINWNYSVKGIQIASGGFRHKWDELKKK